MVHGGYLELSARRGLDGFGHVHHLIRIEVETHHCIVGLGLTGLLLDAQNTAVAGKLHHSVALRVVHAITKHSGLAIALGIDHSLAQQGAKTVAMEDVVAQHQTGTVIANKLLAYDESLGQPVWTWLLGIFQMNAKVGAIAQQTLKTRQVLRRRDDENIAYASQHQS